MRKKQIVAYAEEIAAEVAMRDSIIGRIIARLDNARPSTRSSTARKLIKSFVLETKRSLLEVSASNQIERGIYGRMIMDAERTKK